MKEVTVEVGKHFLDEMRHSVERKKSASEVVLVVPRPGGSVLLHTKAFYPKGAYRLPSGRIHEGENPREAFFREFREELGQDGTIVRDLGALVQKIESGVDSLEFVSYVFLTDELRGEPSPEDESEEITEFIDVPISELSTVAERLRNLPEQWRDWGRWRAAVHDYIASCNVPCGFPP